MISWGKLIDKIDKNCRFLGYNLWVFKNCEIEFSLQILNHGVQTNYG